MVWDFGQTSIHYRKVDSNGNAIVPDRVLLAEPFGAHGPSIRIAGTGLVVGYIRYDPHFGEYRFVVQHLDLEGRPVGPELSIATGDGSQPLDGEMVLATDGGLDIVLAVPDGGIFLHIDAAGRVVQRWAIPFLPRGVLPVIVCGGLGERILAWNSWETGSSGRIVATRITGIGAESVFITPQSMAVADPSLIIEQGGEALLCWEDARSGRGEAYCARLLPDDWDAYPPNLKITGTDSNPGPVAVAVDPGNRVFAAWADDNCLKGSRGFSYGFELAAGSGIIRPHGTASVPVELSNTGGLADTLDLNIDASGLPQGWKAALLAGESYLPASGDMVTILIAITGPDSDAGPHRGSFRIIATSMGNPRLKQELQIPVDMVVGYRTRASLSPSVARAPPGASAPFELQLQNMGDATDELSLGAQVPQGLSVSFGEPNVSLDWSASAIVPVTAWTAESCEDGGSFQFSVMVRSERSGFVSSLSGTVIISPGVQLWLSAATGQKSITPGSSASFAIMVGNAGLSAGPADVGLEIVSGMEGWKASLDPSFVQLAAGENADVSLRIDAPAAAAGRFVVRVVAAARGWASSASITLTAIAEPAHGLQARPDFPQLETLPGSMLLAPVTVSNQGSSPEELSVELSLPAGWSGEPTMDGALARHIAMEPGEAVRLSALIIAPVDAPAGDHEASVIFTARSGVSARAVFNVSVSQVFDLSIQTPTPSLRAAPGEAVVAVLTVRNLGNGLDSIRLETDLPPGWKAYLTDFDQRPAELLVVPAGGLSMVIAQVLVPFSSSDAWSELSIAATSQSGLRARLVLRVGLLLPDLSLRVLYSPQRFVAGQSVLATVEVSNTGESPARNVLVAFNVDGSGTMVERILLIPAGSEKTATFGWTPETGRHVLRFEADPEHTVLEREEGNNIFLEKVAISGAPPEPATIPPALLVAGSASFLLGAIGLVAGGTEYGKYWFLGLLFIPLYTKIKKDDVLDHFVRGQVYGYIKANPGEHYNSIKKALSLKNGTLIYHLKTLERGEFIKSIIDGRFKRFYPKEMKLPEPSDEIVLRMNHIQHEILRIIKESPGISQKEIAARIGLSTPTVHYHINIMMSARIINVKRAGRETQCFVEEVEEGMAG
jgi:uncharacterized membrane protein